jgi:hypothetical protein
VNVISVFLMYLVVLFRDRQYYTDVDAIRKVAVAVMRLLS